MILIFSFEVSLYMYLSQPPSNVKVMAMYIW